MKKKSVHDVRDVIDIDYLQKFQDNLGRVTKVTIAILDPKGVPITQPANLTAFCKMMRSNERGLCICQQIDTKLTSLNKHTKDAVILKCPNSGLKLAAIPIFLKDKYLGSWLIGQVRTGDLNMELIEQTAQKAGFSIEETRKNIAKIPFVTEEEFQNIVSLAHTIAKLDRNEDYISALLNITERKKEEEMKQFAYFDQKLILPNEIQLLRDINELMGSSTYLICFDIRGLRKINDLYGRDSGDILLKQIKDWILQDTVFPGKLYKVGIDEFVILLENVNNKTAYDMAVYIWNRFKEFWYIDLDLVHHQIYVNISIGVLLCDRRYRSIEDLINMLERILSVASEKNKVVNYGYKENEEFHNHLKLEMNLKKCVLNNMEGFSVHYQPIVDPATGLWSGVEALCRFKSPELGIISPAVFIPEAEQHGLITLIGEWVLRESMKQVKAWGLEQYDFILDVNLSPIQLDDPNLYKRIVALLKECDYPPEKLSLEITESAEINFTTHIVTALNKLYELGILLSLDDFGTGYATFTSITNLPIATLKTDRSFMEHIAEDPHVRNTIKIMIEYAHSMNMRVIAEGVETKEQKELLQQMTVDYIQGFYYSKPLTSEQIEQNLHKFSKDYMTAQKHFAANIDIMTLTDTSKGYILSVDLYQSLIQCFALMKEVNLKKIIPKILELIGMDLQVNLIFLSYYNEKSPEKELILHRWQENLTEGMNEVRLKSLASECIAFYQEKGLAAAFQEEYIMQSLFVLPIIREEKVYGVLGLNGRHSNREIWKLEEIQLLYYLCVLLDCYIYLGH